MKSLDLITTLLRGIPFGHWSFFVGLLILVTATAIRIVTKPLTEAILKILNGLADFANQVNGMDRVRKK